MFINKLKIFVVLLCVFLTTCLFAYNNKRKAYADTEHPFQLLQVFESSSPDEGSGFNNLSDFFGVSLNILFGVSIALSIISTITAGIKFITARGNPQAKVLAKQALIYAIVALILAVGAYTIKIIIINLIGGDFGELKNATPNF